ncbi:MAG: hypothetical protein KGS72_19210 [Cyanobacteria bacterium REEB67]|nr:hypothetical protein [Cyanobacteria bacterium REEB67]
MNNNTFTGKGWVEVPEAKLGPNDEILGWTVRRDLPFFALFAQVHIKIDSTPSQVRVTHLVVTGSEEGVRQFHRILQRAVRLHNQDRFPNMIVPRVTWNMHISCRQKSARRTAR